MTYTFTKLHQTECKLYKTTNKHVFNLHIRISKWIDMRFFKIENSFVSLSQIHFLYDKRLEGRRERI